MFVLQSNSVVSSLRFVAYRRVPTMKRGPRRSRTLSIVARLAHSLAHSHSGDGDLRPRRRGAFLLHPRHRGPRFGRERSFFPNATATARLGGLFPGRGLRSSSTRVQTRLETGLTHAPRILKKMSRCALVGAAWSATAAPTASCGDTSRYIKIHKDTDREVHTAHAKHAQNCTTRQRAHVPRGLERQKCDRGPFIPLWRVACRRHSRLWLWTISRVGHTSHTCSSASETLLESLSRGWERTRVTSHRRKRDAEKTRPDCDPCTPPVGVRRARLESAPETSLLRVRLSV